MDFNSDLLLEQTCREVLLPPNHLSKRLPCPALETFLNFCYPNRGAWSKSSKQETTFWVLPVVQKLSVVVSYKIVSYLWDFTQSTVFVER